MSKATFSNISVILWQSVLFVEETGVDHQPAAASYRQISSHNVVSSTPCHERDLNSQC
jgi:hypothetical protein